MYRFYIKLDEEQYGPFSATQIVNQYLDDIENCGDIDVMEESIGVWHKASDYPWAELIQKESGSSISNNGEVRVGPSVRRTRTTTHRNVSTSSRSTSSSESSTSTLQAIALVLSLVGLGCIAYVAIKILSWGVFGWALHYTTGLIGAGCSLIALILAGIASSKEESDNTTMATIAEWISSTCLFVAVAFFILIKVKPDIFNPFM